MGILGGAIGAGLGVVGSVAGGIASSRAMRGVRRDLKAQRRENMDWYNRRYNEDATQRADARAMLDRVEGAVRDRNRQVAGTQAVMGGTDESTAAAKKANSEAMAEMATQVTVNGERRKDAVEERYQQKDDVLRQQLRDIDAAKAGAIAKATAGVVEAGANISSVLDDVGSKDDEKAVGINRENIGGIV